MFVLEIAAEVSPVDLEPNICVEVTCIPEFVNNGDGDFGGRYVFWSWGWFGALLVSGSREPSDINI